METIQRIPQPVIAAAQGTWRGISAWLAKPSEKTPLAKRGGRSGEPVQQPTGSWPKLAQPCDGNDLAESMCEPRGLGGRSSGEAQSGPSTKEGEGRWPSTSTTVDYTYRTPNYPFVSMPKYRMYVDKVGNPGMEAKPSPSQRYLSLTGVIMDLDHVCDVAAPALEELKTNHFQAHPDEPIVLHRKELVNKKPPFAALRDAAVEGAFNADLLQLVRDLNYTVVTVTIDKLEHKQRYAQWAQHPYHYCMEALLERFCHFLQDAPGVGDVMAESRGGGKDKVLKRIFGKLYECGTSFVPARVFQLYLTSRELKVKPKQANIAGLQLADIIAHPSFAATHARKNNQALPATFGGQIAEVLEDSKYRRRWDGRIWGWGCVWLPRRARPDQSPPPGAALPGLTTGLISYLFT
jgi:hypothetical protein